MEGSGNGYLRTACDYVHLNPVRARLLWPEDRLPAYPWSSFPLYLAAREHRPQWLRADRLLGQHGIQQDTPAGRQEFERQLERRRLEDLDPESLRELREGWCIGAEAFRRECCSFLIVIVISPAAFSFRVSGFTFPIGTFALIGG